MQTILEKIRTPYKHNKLVLVPSLKAGDFDSHLVDVPVPFYHNGRYYMLFAGWDSTGYQTGIAVSDDLVNWRKEGLAAGRGEKGSLTEYNIAVTGILRDNELYGPGTLKQVDGRFVGAYHAYPGAGYEEGAAVIGLCSSSDLYHWEVGEPVLRPEDGTWWEKGGLYKSYLMKYEGKYYIFYNAKDKTDGDWKERTGVAFSDDLVNWERYKGNPVLNTGPAGSFDDRFASDPYVLHHDGYWVMFYFGASSDGHARDGAAVSTDLLNWEKTDEILIDVGPEGSIDSTYAHKPGVIAKDGKLYHFYCAVRPAGDSETGEIDYSEIRGITFATN